MKPERKNSRSGVTWGELLSTVGIGVIALLVTMTIVWGLGLHGAAARFINTAVPIVAIMSFQVWIRSRRPR